MRWLRPPPLPGWQSFFESRLRGRVLLRVTRPRLQPGEMQAAQQLAPGTLMEGDGKLLPDPPLQVDTAPAHHAVALKLRPPFDPFRHLRLRRGRQPGRGAIAPRP